MDQLFRGLVHEAMSRLGRRGMRARREEAQANTRDGASYAGRVAPPVVTSRPGTLAQLHAERMLSEVCFYKGCCFGSILLDGQYCTRLCFKGGREVGKDLAPLQRFIRTNFALRGQPHLVKEVFGKILFYDASLQVFLY